MVAGVTRELIEETAIPASVGKLLFVQQFASQRHGRSEELEFFFHIENADDFIDIDLARTSHGTEEISRIDLIDPRKEQILPQFLSTIDIASYIETNQPVYFFDEL